MQKLFVCVVWLIALSANAFAEDRCPSPTVQLSTDVKGKIEGELATLLKLGKIQGAGDIETKTEEFFHLYPDANKAALEQNTLSILCNMVLPSKDYSSDFKQQIINKLIDKVLGDAKKMNWKTYDYKIDRETDSNVLAPSAITIAYPDDWIVRDREPEMGIVLVPNSNSDYGDYPITFDLQILGSTPGGLIGTLSEQLKEPEFPITPSLSDYQREFEIEREVEKGNQENQNFRHEYKEGKIKVDTGSSIEFRDVLFDVAADGNTVRVVTYYIDPFWGSSVTADSDRELLISRFQCDVPAPFSRICGWLFSRVIVHGSTEKAD